MKGDLKKSIDVIKDEPAPVDIDQVRNACHRSVNCEKRCRMSEWWADQLALMLD